MIVVELRAGARVGRSGARIALDPTRIRLDVAGVVKTLLEPEVALLRLGEGVAVDGDPAAGVVALPGGGLAWFPADALRDSDPGLARVVRPIAAFAAEVRPCWLDDEAPADARWRLSHLDAEYVYLRRCAPEGAYGPLYRALPEDVATVDDEALQRRLVPLDLVDPAASEADWDSFLRRFLGDGEGLPPVRSAERWGLSLPPPTAEPATEGAGAGAPAPARPTAEVTVVEASPNPDGEPGVDAADLRARTIAPRREPARTGAPVPPRLDPPVVPPWRPLDTAVTAETNTEPSPVQSLSQARRSGTESATRPREGDAPKLTTRGRGELSEPSLPSRTPHRDAAPRTDGPEPATPPSARPLHPGLAQPTAPSPADDPRNEPAVSSRGDGPVVRTRSAGDLPAPLHPRRSPPVVRAPDPPSPTPEAVAAPTTRSDDAPRPLAPGRFARATSVEAAAPAPPVVRAPHVDHPDASRTDLPRSAPRTELDFRAATVAVELGTIVVELGDAGRREPASTTTPVAAIHRDIDLSLSRTGSLLAEIPHVRGHRRAP